MTRILSLRFYFKIYSRSLLFKKNQKTFDRKIILTMYGKLVLYCFTDASFSPRKLRQQRASRCDMSCYAPQTGVRFSIPYGHVAIRKAASSREKILSSVPFLNIWISFANEISMQYFWQSNTIIVVQNLHSVVFPVKS